jgi:PPOX class probable FMN-dependent enzyme
VDWFAGALGSEEELRPLYDPPKDAARRKDIGRIDPLCRRLIAASPLVLVASAAADGRCDVTPRGGPAGFVTVLDDGHVAIPDATGNKRLDSLANVVANGHAGLLFVIPGRAETLRVNGRACVSTDSQLLDGLTAVGKPPRSALVVAADEVYAHCPKAFIRSRLWEPETWPAAVELPSPAEVTLAHLRLTDPELTLAEVEQSQRESLLYRLD